MKLFSDPVLPPNPVLLHQLVEEELNSDVLQLEQLLSLLRANCEQIQQDIEQYVWVVFNLYWVYIMGGMTSSQALICEILARSLVKCIYAPWGWRSNCRLAEIAAKWIWPTFRPSMMCIMHCQCHKYVAGHWSLITDSIYLTNTLFFELRKQN